MSRIKLAAGGFFLAAWFLVFRDTLSSLYHLAASDEGHSHVLALPFLVSFFLFVDRKRIFNRRRANPGLQRALSWIFIGAGLGVFLAGTVLPGAWALHDRLSMNTASAILLLAGISLGVARDVDLAEAVFPFILLFLMVPIPTGAREALVAFLVKGSTALTEVFFTLTGTTFYREGSVFMLPGVTIEIADVCSGIRSSIGLLITALLAAHLFLNKTWSKGVLLTIVLPMAVVKNAMRITALTLLSVYVDRSFLDNSLHHTYGGVVFFGLTLVLFLFPVLWLLRKLEEKEPNPLSLNGFGT